MYELDEKPGQFALTKRGLLALDHLAGLQWLYSRVYYDPREPYIAKCVADAKIRDLDGTTRNQPETKIVDLRDGSPEAQKMTDAWHRKLRKEGKPIPEGPAPQLARARMHVCANAESKAQNRVRRAILGLQSSFSKSELQLPFVILTLVPVIDMNDPVIRRIVAMQQLGVSAELYGQALRAIEAETTEAQTPPSPPPVAPPEDTRGLDIPVAPPAIDAEAEVVPTDADKIAEEHRQEREAKVLRIEGLYMAKTGKERDPRKPPLRTLDDDQLDAIEQLLSSKPDAKKLL